MNFPLAIGCIECTDLGEILTTKAPSQTASAVAISINMFVRSRQCLSLAVFGEAE